MNVHVTSQLIPFPNFDRYTRLRKFLIEEQAGQLDAAPKKEMPEKEERRGSEAACTGRTQKLTK